MNYPTGTLSNEAYIEGLQDNNTSVLEAVYADFQLPVVRSITALGGSEAAGRSFFRTGIVEAAKQARAGALSTGVPFFYHLKSFSLAHFADWLTERGQPLPEIEPDPDAPGGATEIPDAEALRETRATIDAWKKGERTEDPGYLLWEKLRRIEHRFTEGEKARPKSNFSRNLLIAIVLITAAVIAYLYFFRSKTPAQVYDDNFTLPESMLSDQRSRYGPERGNDSVTARPNACEFFLQEADHFYKAKDYESAQAVLLEILEDSLAACHSDALFYIGIIALQQEEPGMALECFSKIEDLEHFGDDIYWYQALAFVKLAEKNPLLRDKAVRAVERARSNARDSLRRVQAEKMLKNLSD